jgi:hypothetical protein
MKVYALNGTPSPELSNALVQFEQQFAYPLGVDQYFRIQHHIDYTRFYRAIGDAVCFIAESKGSIMGIISVAIRNLLQPNGKVIQTAYIGDLKINPSSNCGRTLIELTRAAEQWVKKRVTSAFGVVMEGTSAIPPQYTGRLGVPLFQEVAKITVLQIAKPFPPFISQDTIEIQSNCEIANARLSNLSRGRCACIGGHPTLRSEMKPAWLIASNGQACAMLEDTRNAKRLITNDGKEIANAHLSYFAYKDLPSAIELLMFACQLISTTQHSGLFVSVAESDTNQLIKALKGWNLIVAPATVFGFEFEFETKFPWNINTAEI